MPRALAIPRSVTVSEAISNVETDLEHMIGFLFGIKRTLHAHRATLHNVVSPAAARTSRETAAADWGAFLAELRSVFGDEWFTVGRIAADPHAFTIPESLDNAYSRGKARGFERSLGKAFARIIGTRYGKLRLTRRFETHTKQAEWKVVATEAARPKTKAKRTHRKTR